MEDSQIPQFNKKLFFLFPLIFLSLLTFTILGALTASLIQPKNLLISKTLGNKTETPKSSGYIIEFKDKPLVEYQKEIGQAGRAESSETINYENKTLKPNHEAAKKDILKRLGQNVLSETSQSATSSVSLKPSMPPAPSKPVPPQQKTPKVLAEYTTVFNGIALDITEAQVNEIQKSPYVKNIYPNLEVKTMLNQSVPLINADKVWQLKDSQGKNLTGQGINIGIIDTGIDLTHQDLGSSVITERNFQLIRPLDDSWPRILQVDEDKVIYFTPADHKIHLYALSTGRETTIDPLLPNLWVRKAVLKDDVLVYYAMNQDWDAALYINYLTKGIHKKIVDTQGVGTISISNGKVIYGRLKEPRFNSPGPYVYTYDLQSGYETPLTNPIFSTSLESIMPQVNGDQVIVLSWVYKPGEIYCPQKAVIWNMKDYSSRDLYPPQLGEIMDFKGNKILYTACSPESYNAYFDTFYLYDINTGENLKLSYPKITEGVQISASSDHLGVHTTNLLNNNIDKIKTNSSGNISTQATFYAEYWYNSYASLGSKTIFFTQNSKRHHVIAYDRITQRYVKINLLRLPQLVIQANDDRICFTFEDKGLYCHTYEPNNPYDLPATVFNKKVVGGYNFIDPTDNPLDDYGHGTHVAAIAAGNGILKGVAPDAQIYSYKVTDFLGQGTASTIISALEKAVQARLDADLTNDIHVINISMGATCYQYDERCGPNDTMSQAVDNTVDAGIVVVISAGNGGPTSNTIGSPGTARKAITVGSVNNNKQISSFSSRGPVIYREEIIQKPDVVAPGEPVCAAEWDSFREDLKCQDNKHVSLMGTSMATPHVTGAAALIKQAHSDWTPEQIKNALKSTAQNLNLSSDIQGSGLINVLSALSATSSVKPRVCAQVLTSAKNPTTNECKTFPTPCDVPSGWTPVDSCPKIQKGSFSKLSANLNQSGASFSFSYKGPSSQYFLNISTSSNMSKDTYSNFINGTKSPLVLNNPTQKWNKYQCGQTLYWKITNQTGDASPVQKTQVNCSPQLPLRLEPIRLPSLRPVLPSLCLSCQWENVRNTFNGFLQRLQIKR